MAANRVGSLNAILTAQTGKFDSKMKASSKVVKRTGLTMGKVTKKVLKYGAAFAAVALGGVALFVRASLKNIDVQAKLASTLRVSTESLSAYNLAADITGTEMTNVSNSLLKMTKNLGDAKQGIGTGIQGLNQLGLSIKDLKGLNTEQQFELIADRIKGIQDPLDKASAGAAIFGGKFKKIQNFVELGSEGFAKFREETEGFGTALTQVDAAKVELANDAMRRVKEIFNGVIQQLTIRLAPIITVIAERIVGAGKDAKGFGGILDTVVNFGIKGAGFLIDTWDGLKIVWAAGKVALADIGIVGNKALNELTKGFQLAGQIGSAVWGVLSNGIQSIGATFGLIFTLIENTFRSFIRFTGTALANVLERASSGLRLVKGMSSTADALLDASTKITGAVGGLTAKNTKNLDAAQAKLSGFSTAAIDAQKKLGTLITGGGPELEENQEALDRIKTLEQLKQSAIGDIKNLAEKERASVSFERALSAAVEETNAEAALIAERETAKTQMIVTADQERKVQLMEQQAAWQDQFGKSEAAAVQKNQDLWKSGMRGRMKVVGGVLSSIGNLMNSENRKAFEIGKAASIGSTTIATIETSMQAYKSLAGIPIVGPALGIAAATAAAVSGAMAVNQIRSTSFGGGGSPSFSGGGGGSSVSAASAASAPAGSGQDFDALAANQAVDVTISADDEGGMVSGRWLVDVINRVQADGKLIKSIALGTTNNRRG